MLRLVLLLVALSSGANLALGQFFPQPPAAPWPNGLADPRFGNPAWGGPQLPIGPPRVPITQLRNRQSGEFLYTNDAHEVATLAQSGIYDVQGQPFSVLAQRQIGTRPLIRYIRGNGTHFLATTPQPARPEITLGFVAVRPSPGTLPLITWHNPQASQDFYTTDPNNLQPANLGFQRADVLGYVLP